MKRRSRWVSILAVSTMAVVATGAVASRVSGCGPFLTFRAYLKRSFWQPVRYVIEEGVGTRSAGATPPRRYAGFVESNAPEPLAKLRLAYTQLSGGPFPESFATNPDHGVLAFPKSLESARRASAEALAQGALTGSALEEARLLDAKIALRAAEADRLLLPKARQKIQAFLAAGPSPAFASEARGWLARTLFLQGDGVSAAKIYLDELDAAASTMTRETLANSLRIVYISGEQQFWDRAEELLDTPRHALLVLNLLTNPTNYDAEEVSIAEMSRRRARILTLLAGHRDLFRSGSDSDALVMASMRVAVFGGDLDAALQRSRDVSAASTLHESPEFNWLVATSLVLKGEPAQAEAPLLRMLNAPSATGADRRTAAQALAGVYVQTHRPVDALHASFVEVSVPEDDSVTGRAAWPYRGMRPQWCGDCKALDLPYLLDAWLTDGELLEYLKKYPEPITLAAWVDYRESPSHSVPKPTAAQFVRYALAVRAARGQHYEEAERLYRELAVANRAARMQKLAGLWARAQDSRLAPADHWQALYDYAAFLAENPERIFFNDRLWSGYQQWALHDGTAEWARMDNESGMSAEESARVAATDRRLRDEQEERWQAYQALLPVAREATAPALRKQAVIKMLDCLVRISPDRFGRADEINREITTWVAWLKQRKGGSRQPPLGGTGS